MPINRSDIADFTYFVTIARHRNFRLAGLELGVSASALSHALKGLETRLGVRLLNRTSRSVTLTSAGEELLQSITGPFDAISAAVEDLNKFRDAPAGRIRLNVPGDAARQLIAPVLPSFLEKYPDVEIDVVVSNAMTDVIEGGFDAGIRFGGTVPKDMIAQRLSGEITWVVVGAPSYLEKYGEPQHPNDLLSHRCLKIRIGNGEIYDWEMGDGDATITVPVEGMITIDESQFALELAKRGVALMYTSEPTAAHQIAEGSLKEVLTEWRSPGPAYHIYYSSRRQLPAGLRLLIEHIREMRPLGL